MQITQSDKLYPIVKRQPSVGEALELVKAGRVLASARLESGSLVVVLLSGQKFVYGPDEFDPSMTGREKRDQREKHDQPEEQAAPRSDRKRPGMPEPAAEVQTAAEEQPATEVQPAAKPRGTKVIKKTAKKARAAKPDEPDARSDRKDITQ